MRHQLRRRRPQSGEVYGDTMLQSLQSGDKTLILGPAGAEYTRRRTNTCVKNKKKLYFFIIHIYILQIYLQLRYIYKMK